jgi:uncharacterized protein (TIGR01244 family)
VFPERLEPDGFRDVLADVGPAYIAGQPDEAALERLAAEGVSTVISLRTPQEMDNREVVPFDEAATLAALGLDYVHIPLGSDEYPYTEDAVDAFAAALEGAEGKTLLHCTVAWRASHMWAAYLIKYQGMSVEDAVRHAEAINFGAEPPLVQMLDLQLVYAPDDADGVVVADD